MLADYRETISDLLLDTFTDGVGRRGREAGSDRCATRRTARRRASSICTRRATSPRPRAPRSSASSGRPPPPTWPGGRSSRPKPRRGSASTSAPRSPTSAPPSIASSSPGVNHIFYHGTAYSPAREPWPGWLFYAAVEFSPQNAWWDDFGTLNSYVARVAVVSAGRPARPRRAALLPALRVAGRARKRAADALRRREPTRAGHDVRGSGRRGCEAAGFTYDFISDRQIRRDACRRRPARHRAAARPTASSSLPSARYIPLETFEHVLRLARSGATVVSLQGLAVRRRRPRRPRREPRAVEEPRRRRAVRPGRRRRHPRGHGRTRTDSSGRRHRARAGSRRRSTRAHGRPGACGSRAASTRAGAFYFVSNPGERAIDGWVPFEIDARVDRRSSIR